MEYSQVILNYMENHGVTGYRLSKATGISESLFGKWRKNPTSKIDALTLTKISEYFGISVDTLIGKEQTKTPTVITDDERSKRIAALYNLIQDMPTEDLDYLIAKTKAIKEIENRT